MTSGVYLLSISLLIVIDKIDLPQLPAYLYERRVGQVRGDERADWIVLQVWK